MANTTPCALCGRNDVRRIIGATGCACVFCLGEAAKQAIAQQHVISPPNVTASDRCLLCGEVIATGSLAAVKSPYALCHSCLVDALGSAADFVEKGRFLQVNF